MMPSILIRPTSAHTSAAEPNISPATSIGKQRIIASRPYLIKVPEGPSGAIYITRTDKLDPALVSLTERFPLQDAKGVMRHRGCLEFKAAVDDGKRFGES